MVGDSVHVVVDRPAKTVYQPETNISYPLESLSRVHTRDEGSGKEANPTIHIRIASSEQYMHEPIEQRGHLTATCIPACTHIGLAVKRLESLKSSPTPTPIVALHSDLQYVRSTVQRPSPAPITAVLGCHLLELTQFVLELSGTMLRERFRSGHLAENLCGGCRYKVHIGFQWSRDGLRCLGALPAGMGSRSMFPSKTIDIAQLIVENRPILLRNRLRSDLFEET
jgi:hypothetical protein